MLPPVLTVSRLVERAALRPGRAAVVTARGRDLLALEDVHADGHPPLAERAAPEGAALQSVASVLAREAGEQSRLEAVQVGPQHDVEGAPHGACAERAQGLAAEELDALDGREGQGIEVAGGGGVGPAVDEDEQRLAAGEEVAGEPVSRSSWRVWAPERSMKSRSYFAMTRGAGAREPACAVLTASSAARTVIDQGLSSEGECLHRDRSSSSWSAFRGRSSVLVRTEDNPAGTTSGARRERVAANRRAAAKRRGNGESPGALSMRHVPRRASSADCAATRPRRPARAAFSGSPVGRRGCSQCMILSRGRSEDKKSTLFPPERRISSYRSEKASTRARREGVARAPGGGAPSAAVPAGGAGGGGQWTAGRLRRWSRFTDSITTSRVESLR